MRKNIFIWILFFATNFSCNSHQNEVQKENRKILDLGVDELTLTPLPNDTTGIHVELGMPSGDYTMFYFKNISRSLMNPTEKIRGLFVEIRRSENKNTPSTYYDSLKTVNYHSYAFEINRIEWDTIKNKADEIELTADTSYKNYYCEFCPTYTLIYNGKRIEDKLTDGKKVEKLFTYLINRYS